MFETRFRVFWPRVSRLPTRCRRSRETPAERQAREKGCHRPLLLGPGWSAATRVVLPPKSDTGYARENKIDDVSAVLQYGVVSTTSELREHGRDDPVP